MSRRIADAIRTFAIDDNALPWELDAHGQHYIHEVAQDYILDLDRRLRPHLPPAPAWANVQDTRTALEGAIAVQWGAAAAPPQQHGPQQRNVRQRRQ